VRWTRAAYADGVGGHPGSRLQARAGGHVHDRPRTAFPQVRDHRLGQAQRRAHIDVDHEPQVPGRRRERLAQLVRADGIDQHLRRADFGGDPVDDAPGRGRVGRVGRLAPDAVRQLLQPLLAPVDPGHREPGGRQLLRRRTAEPAAARTGHDRHTLAHAATSAETAPKTDDVARLLPVMNGPHRSGCVQAHHREGEKPSPDSGDLEAVCGELRRPGARRRWRDDRHVGHWLVPRQARAVQGLILSQDPAVGGLRAG
jgi:hypothetical protein